MRLTLVKQQFLLTKILQNYKNDEKCIELIRKATELQAELGDHCLSESSRKCLETDVQCVFACGSLTRDGDGSGGTKRWVRDGGLVPFERMAYSQLLQAFSDQTYDGRCPFSSLGC